jgi:hypothetical protein
MGLKAGVRRAGMAYPSLGDKIALTCVSSADLDSPRDPDDPAPGTTFMEPLRYICLCERCRAVDRAQINEPRAQRRADRGFNPGYQC